MVGGQFTSRLFTNNLGQIVFADQDFIKLMKYPSSMNVTGEPLFKALGVDQKLVKPLLDHLLKTGRLETETLKITRQTGDPLILAIAGEASYDANGMYIGADIMVREAISAAEEQTDEDDDTLPTKPHLNESALEANNIFLQLYFTTHIKALYILLSRLVGVKVQGNLDKAINDAARRYNATLNIKAGLFTTDLSDIKTPTYQGILKAAMTYATNMIGPKIVSGEIEKIDSQMHPGVIVLATQAGLRDFAQ